MDYIRIGMGHNDLVKIYDDQKYAEPEAIFFAQDFIRRENLTLAGSHDIALIKLKKPLKFDKTIQPACLSKEEKKVYEGVLKVGSMGLLSEPHFPLFKTKLFSTEFRRLISLLKLST